MELDYTICIGNSGTSSVEVRCCISHIEEHELVLQFGEKGHQLEGVDERVICYEAVSEGGVSLEVERVDPDTWRIIDIASSEIHWRYVLELPDHFCAYNVSFWADSYAHLYIPQIFMVPEPIADGSVFVSFLLPEDWEVHTLWTLTDGRYCPGSLRSLCRGYLALGHYQYHESIVDRATVKIAISEELACHPTPFSAIVERILQCQASIFNKQVEDDLLIICQNAGRRSWGGSPSSGVIALAVPGNCTDESLTRDRYERGKTMNPLRLVNHELFHTWSIGHFAAPRQVDYWRSEGITSYYTLLTASRLHLMNEDGAYQLLYDLYERLNENPYIGVLTAVEAGVMSRETGGQEARQMDALCVGKGMLFAFFLDVEIRYSTRNGAGLDELMRRLHKHPELGSHKRGWSYHDLCEILSEFASVDLMFYIDRYIEGTESIPFLEVLHRTDLDIREINGKKEVTRRLGVDSFAGLVRRSIFSHGCS